MTPQVTSKRGHEQIVTGTSQALLAASAGNVMLDRFTVWYQEHCTLPPAPCRLFLRLVSEPSLKAATAAATRVVKNSASLTAVNVVEQEYGCYTPHPLMLSDLLAAGATSGLATRLRVLTGITVTAAFAVQQLQALRHCTSLTHLDIRGRDLQVYLKQHCQQAALELTAALQGLHLLTCLRVPSVRQGTLSHAML